MTEYKEAVGSTTELIEEECVECGAKYLKHTQSGIAFCGICNYLAGLDQE